MTQMSKSSWAWAGRTGAIDETLLRRVVGELAQPISYVAGPPAMVESMRQSLNHAGVDDDDIRSEEFYGY
jgi:NAD(P)H-flavin reductase